MNSTGNDLESNDILDFEDNTVNLDILMNADQEYWTDRLGNNRPTIDYALRMAGFTPAGFDFTTGGVLKNGDRNKCVFNQADQTWYSWSGNLPYNVIAGSAPGEGWKVVESNRNKPVRSVSSLTKLKTLNTVVGDIYRTGSYHEGLTYGGALYLVTDDPNLVPDGYGDHQCVNGKKLFLLSEPTDVNHGVRLNIEFDPNIAWGNRNTLQALTRNIRWNLVSLVAGGTYYVLGSIHPNRSDLTIQHNSGCKIIGRYDDQSVPKSSISQGGHLFGFAGFKDPDNGDFSYTGPLVKITYILNGIVSTEYSPSHSKSHNNNCIGFYNVKDCSVTGNGGVGGSDHRGINFDGLGVNCHIDISFVTKTSDEPLVMKGSLTEKSKCTVKVGRVYNCLFDGSNPPCVIRVQDLSVGVVKIGSFNSAGSKLPILVGAYNSEHVEVEPGIVDGVSQILRQYETLHGVVKGGLFKNVQYGIIRAGTVENKMVSGTVVGIKSVDTVFLAPYYSEFSQGVFNKLTIKENDFSGAGTGFIYYKNKFTSGLAKVLNISDNISPNGFTVVEINKDSYSATNNLVTPNTATLVVDYKTPDWKFEFLSVTIESSGERFIGMVNLRQLDLSIMTHKFKIGDVTASCSRVGSVLTITLSAGTFQIATLHN